jgi:hypothetical protein
VEHLAIVCQIERTSRKRARLTQWVRKRRQLGVLFNDPTQVAKVSTAIASDFRGWTTYP